MSDDTMKLPEGKTCADCVHFRRCEGFIGGLDPSWLLTATHCDWAPSRFRDRDAHIADLVAEQSRVQALRGARES